MPSYEFMTVDVFTDKRFGGNPLAVFPDAGGLTDEQMQAIAAEFNLSETTFILPPEDPRNHARVRIFTPRAEMPFAGHPNVGPATSWPASPAIRRNTIPSRRLPVWCASISCGTPPAQSREPGSPRRARCRSTSPSRSIWLPPAPVSPRAKS